MCNKRLKILICGLGSIGQRHALNLLDIGYKNLIFLRTKSKNKLNTKLKKYTIFNNLKDAINEKPDVAFICNTTDKHIYTATILANQKIHLFIEKPAGFKKKGFKNLIYLCKKNKITNMVGYMMRFHPAVKIIKKILNNKKNGPFFYFRSEWGEYLPNWHPKENYKKSYAANRKMGGDIGLTLSHDLDLAKYFFGEINYVMKLKQKNNILKINSDSITDFFVYFKNNINGNIHLDYLQKNNSRTWKIDGLNCSILFDYYKNKLVFKKKSKIKTYYFNNFKRNNLFKDEIQFFISNLYKKQKIDCDIKHSFNLLNDFKLLY